MYCVVRTYVGGLSGTIGFELNMYGGKLLGVVICHVWLHVYVISLNSIGSLVVGAGGIVGKAICVGLWVGGCVCLL